MNQQTLKKVNILDDFIEKERNNAQKILDYQVLFEVQHYLYNICKREKVAIDDLKGKLSHHDLQESIDQWNHNVELFQNYTHYIHNFQDVLLKVKEFSKGNRDE